MKSRTYRIVKIEGKNKYIIQKLLRILFIKIWITETFRRPRYGPPGKYDILAIHFESIEECEIFVKSRGRTIIKELKVQE